MTDAFLNNLERKRLIRADPITCARYYKHHADGFVNTCLIRCPEFVGEIVDSFHVYEFQKRGTAHRHGMLYVRDCLEYNNQDTAAVQQCLRFIDRIITCDSDHTDLINYPDVAVHQIHRCQINYCKRHNKNACRFRAPWPPMPATCILEPFDDSEKEKDTFKKNKANWETIQKKIVQCDHLLASFGQSKWHRHGVSPRPPSWLSYN